jgi:hypothetical protein
MAVTGKWTGRLLAGVALILPETLSAQTRVAGGAHKLASREVIRHRQHPGTAAGFTEQRVPIRSHPLSPQPGLGPGDERRGAPHRAMAFPASSNAKCAKVAASLAPSRPISIRAEASRSSA